jgi:hypothetical protein
VRVTLRRDHRLVRQLVPRGVAPVIGAGGVRERARRRRVGFDVIGMHPRDC